MSTNTVGETTGLRLPVQRGCPFTPPAEYEQLRTLPPIGKVHLFDGSQGWLVTGHEAGRAVLADRRFSSDRRKDGFPFFLGDAAIRKQLREQPQLMLGMDGDEHAAARRPVIGEFTVKRLAALRPRIQDIVDRFIDDMLAGDRRPVDLVQALSLPVPSLVICELLGVPYDDHDYFQTRTAMLVRRTTTPQDRQQALGELRAYIEALVTRKESEPGDDLISRQIARRDSDGDGDRGSLVSLALLLLAAGHETTANMISLGVLGLLNHPRQLELIRSDPEKTPMAVEELLRYFAITDVVTARVADADVRIGDVTIKAGDGVVVSGLAANRDGSVFAEPDELDVERSARHHLAFGYGPHQCLGQNLARLELRIVFDTLFRRIPGLRSVVPVEELSYKSDAIVYGVDELPVDW